MPQDAVEMQRPFGLHPTVLLMAGTHFLVDGFSNIYAPLLPLLIPHLSLSLAAAGTLQMCFLMANSVSQLAFGHIADRWRPRALLIAGPLFTVTLLPLIGLASTPVALGVILTVGRSRRGRLSSTGGGVGPSAGRHSSGLRDVVSHHWRLAWFFARAARFCTVRGALWAGLDAAPDASGACGAGRRSAASTDDRAISPSTGRPSGFAPWRRTENR